MSVRYTRIFGLRNCASMKWNRITSRGSPFFSYIAKKNSGIMTAIMPSAARLIFPVRFSRKKDGTPMSAAREKQISCRLVRLNKTLLFTFVRSLGTEI